MRRHAGAGRARCGASRASAQPVADGGRRGSGAGGGGIIIALVESDKQVAVAEAITAAGGDSFMITTGVPGVRLEPETTEF